MRIFITGASGFVGRNIIPTLLSLGYEVTAAVRTRGTAPRGTTEVKIPDMREVADWKPYLRGHNAVIHLAARVHVMAEVASDPLGEFRAANVDVTRELGEAARAEGVGNFLFLSSIKVNGEGKRSPYSTSDPAAPEDPYGISKYEAELALASIPGLNYVVIRPVLIYGPGVGGNFERLYNLARKNIPLPLRGVNNRRSFLGAGNLANLFHYLLQESYVAGSLVIASDNEVLSTSELITQIRRSLNIPDWQITVPQKLLEWPLRIIGKGAIADRLFGSLEVSYGSSDSEFHWKPPHNLSTELQRMVEANG